MSNYASLKATINANIKTNGNQEITGSVLNSVLNAMTNALGAGYQYLGIATPTNPGTNQTPDYRCFYIATTPGTYSHLGGLVVADGEVAILKYDSAWTKEVTGIATAAQLNQLGQEVHNPFLEYPGWMSNVTGTYQNLANTSFVVIPVREGASFWIKKNPSSSVQYAFLNSFSGVPTTTFDINGQRASITSSTPVTGIVPTGAKYIYLLRKYGGNYWNLPTIKIDDVEITLPLDREILESVKASKDVIDTKIASLLRYSPTFIAGAYINVTTGFAISASAYDHTDYFVIVSRKIILTSYFSDAAGVSFYDKNKSFISGYQRPADVSLGESVTIDVPGNAYFCRASVIHANRSSFYIDAFLEHNTGEISARIKGNNDSISTMSEINLGTLVDGIVDGNTGNFGASSANKRTGKIRLNATRLSIVVTHSDNGRGCAFYDERGFFISGVNFADYSLGQVIEVDVPARTFFFATCATNALATQMSVKSVNLSSPLNKIAPISDNPCYYNLSSEARVFKKVLCIGDSLTAGRFDYRENGVTHEFEDASLSWPSFFSAISGRQTTNVGDAGETTKTWWELHQNDDLSGHDACVIALGRNDYVAGRETTSEERILYMTNIINKVKAENPQIKIFVSTLINYYTGAGADAVNADMRTIANTLADCYLVDISLYGNLVASIDRYSHCTAVGYQKLAECYFRYVSYIMANNPSDFMNIQFIGTNRSY